MSRPDLPDLPSIPDIDVRRRISRDKGGDSPMLSLAGGLLLGVLVGIVVAIILTSQTGDEESPSARHTGITLLPHREGEDQPNEGKSAASTG